MSNIYEIANKIKLNGGNIYLVGGAIRDNLLGIENHDEDYCVTEISFDEFKMLFPEAVIRGKDFPVFSIDNKEFAIAKEVLTNKIIDPEGGIIENEKYKRKENQNMKIIYGTSNKNKVTAMEKILKENHSNFELYTLKDIGFNKEIIEDGKTFEENSNIKAMAIKEFCNENNINDKIIVTDDSGLCIDKLNGEPGVYSARYAGPNATQVQSLTKVLNKMKDYPNKEDRACTFVTVLTAILPDGEKIVARGECKGTVAKSMGKLGGLTYIPIFIPDGFDKPLSDLDKETFEATHNHRDLAVKQLLAEFKKRNIK